MCLALIFSAELLGASAVWVCICHSVKAPLLSIPLFCSTSHVLCVSELPELSYFWVDGTVLWLEWNCRQGRTAFWGCNIPFFCIRKLFSLFWGRIWSHEEMADAKSSIFKGQILSWSGILPLFRSHSWSQKGFYWHSEIQNILHYPGNKWQLTLIYLISYFSMCIQDIN